MRSIPVDYKTANSRYKFVTTVSRTKVQIFMNVKKNVCKPTIRGREREKIILNYRADVWKSVRGKVRGPTVCVRLHPGG